MTRELACAALLLLLLPVAGCELNRTAPEEIVETDRSGFPDKGDGTGLPKYEKERAACVDRINAFRGTEGRKPLTRWVEAEDCSDLEAKSDSETGKAHGAFGACKERAQNECPGWGSVQSTVDGCLQMMWDERLHPEGEQGHYRNMRNEKYSMVACGFYETPGGRVWALQNFR